MEAPPKDKQNLQHVTLIRLVERYSLLIGS